MMLVDAKQLDQKQHRIVGWQFVLFAEFLDRLCEFLVVIGRRLRLAGFVGSAHGLEGSKRSAADSISE